MNRWKWRAVGLLILTVGVVVSAWGWVGFQARRAPEAGYQLRLSRWGGRSQELPRYPSSLQQVRKIVGDDIFFSLTGSDGRVVGARRGVSPGDPTKEELAELLERQPIRQAFFAGSKNLDDDWLAGIKEPGAVKFLSLDGTGVTDRSAATIAEMTNLEVLGLADTAISDAAVDRLRRLPGLAHLYVGGPNIRSIRLVDPRLVDTQGRNATRSETTLRVEGQVEVANLSGDPSAVRVMVRPEGTPPARASFPYGWNVRIGEVGTLTRESSGKSKFSVEVAGIPPGRSSVEVWVENRFGIGPKIVYYRLQPFLIDLAEPVPLVPDGDEK